MRRVLGRRYEVLPLVPIRFLLFWRLFPVMQLHNIWQLLHRLWTSSLGRPARSLNIRLEALLFPSFTSVREAVVAGSCVVNVSRCQAEP